MKPDGARDLAWSLVVRSGSITFPHTQLVYGMPTLMLFWVHSTGWGDLSVCISSASLWDLGYSHRFFNEHQTTAPQFFPAARAPVEYFSRHPQSLWHIQKLFNRYIHRPCNGGGIHSLDCHINLLFNIWLWDQLGNLHVVLQDPRYRDIHNTVGGANLHPLRWDHLDRLNILLLDSRHKIIHDLFHGALLDALLWDKKLPN